MVEIDSDNSNFLRGVYTKVKTNGHKEIVPLKLYTDVSVENITLPWASAQETTTPVGTIVGNRYLIQRVLGQGGFGRTYLAFDQYCFNKSCVLKEFVPNLIEEKYVQKSRNLFEREARILYQIDHPQIPKLLACFEDDGRLFLVQEYIEGKTYSTLLKERSQQEGAFSEVEIIQWLKELLPVLDYIHQHNIIHRDISPDNIILNSHTNLPVLIDFGVGKQGIELSNAEQAIVKQKSVVGKMGYSPPEQMCRGRCFPSSDLYALGVTTIVLLTGRAPEELLEPNSLEWQWHEYTDVSSKLAQVLDKMLADKPKDRYQSAPSVLAALEFPMLEVTTASQSSISSVVCQQPKATECEIEQNHLLTPAFIELCQQELAHCIGPIASFLIQKVLNENPEIFPQALINALVEQIPNQQQAIAFRNRLL